VPSAVFVETVYGMSGVELTPGLSSSASCPEAIWQSAKWWHNFYEGDGGREGQADISDADETSVPKGFYLLRQPAATAVGPKDRVVGSQVVRRDGGAAEKGGAKARKRGRTAKAGGSRKGGGKKGGAGR
jgi:hypothetical protein